MSKNTIEVDYQKLRQIADQFGEQAEVVQGIYQRIQSYTDGMEWRGVGADVFRREINEVLLPIIARLQHSLLNGGERIEEIGIIFSQAEEEATGFFSDSLGVQMASGAVPFEEFLRRQDPDYDPAGEFLNRQPPSLDRFNDGTCSDTRDLVDGGVYDANGNPIDGPVSKVFINGIRTDAEGFMKLLAHQNIDKDMVGIFNNTDGGHIDLYQAGNDQLQSLINWRISPDNPAVISLKEQVISSIQDNRTFEIKAHSQGGLITSAALSQLAREGYSAEQLSKIKVTTYGSAGTFFPDGPKYTHYVLATDPIPVIAETMAPVTKNYYSNRVLLPPVRVDPHGMDSYHASLDVFQEGTIQQKGANFILNVTRTNVMPIEMFRRGREALLSLF